MKWIVLSALIALGACDAAEVRPKPSAAADVVRSDPGAAAMWPALLQHCLRDLACDPLIDFGLGAGSASGVEQQAGWVAEIMPDGGKAIRITFQAPRGKGGEAGRPLTLDETPASLRTARERASWLVMEHAVSDAGTEPSRIHFRAAHVALTLADLANEPSGKARIDRTAEHIAAFVWPDGGQGIRVTLSTPASILFAAYASGEPVVAPAPPPTGTPNDFAPWVFGVETDAADPMAAPLMAAAKAGETLTLRLETPDGLVLEDAVYLAGYASALERAQSALNDPAIHEPLTVRCKDLINEADEFWLQADVSPALLTCDPRPPTKRHADEQAAQGLR